MGGDSDLAYVDQLSVGFWLKLMHNNPATNTWDPSIMNYAFLMSDNPADSYNYQIFSLGTNYYKFKLYNTMDHQLV